MRLARLLLLATIALVVTAFTAPAAFGQNIEVLGEEHAGGVEEVHHCPPVSLSEHVVTGGCAIHANSEGVGAVLVLHHPTTQVEEVISICNNEFLGRVGENGLGWITGQILGGVNCGITPCDEPATGSPAHANLPWPAGLFEVAPGEEVLTTTFCVRSLLTQEGAQGTPCTVVVEANPQANHAWEFRATDVPCVEDNGVELTGHWVTEGEGFETSH
jgi:hypothetical protein